jgi:hypothetical protein
MLALLASLAFASLNLVAGHGYVQQVTLGSTIWPGWNPNIDPFVYLSVI